jgi:hypothetical protein
MHVAAAEQPAPLRVSPPWMAAGGLSVVTETVNAKMKNARGGAPAGISHCMTEPSEDCEQVPPPEPQDWLCGTRVVPAGAVVLAINGVALTVSPLTNWNW